jgi:metallo-beta-lactamase class B
MKAKTISCVIPIFLLLFTVSAVAQYPAEWLRPFPAFRIAGIASQSPGTNPDPQSGLYYVGSEDLASYLIATPKGLILINSSLEASVPLIRKSVESLGFNFRDVKILLISHAHADHCAGSAEIIRLTGAKYYVMAGDVPVVESGGKEDFQYGTDKSMRYPPAHVDRILHDGDTVSLGGAVLTAHLTAGHTKGTTTWTMDAREGGRLEHVVMVGSPNVNGGYRLVDNKAYPQIASDYKSGFAVLNGLPCDIFLGAHGAYFDLTEKYARWKNGERNAFIDPAGYKAYIADREQAFEKELKQQLAAQQPAARQSAARK